MAPLPTLLPIDSGDAKAMRRFAEDQHRLRAGLAQDFAHIVGWTWLALIWPIRRVIRAIRR